MVFQTMTAAFYRHFDRVLGLPGLSPLRQMRRLRVLFFTVGGALGLLGLELSQAFGESGSWCILPFVLWWALLVYRLHMVRCSQCDIPVFAVATTTIWGELPKRCGACGAPLDLQSGREPGTPETNDEGETRFQAFCVDEITRYLSAADLGQESTFERIVDGARETYFKATLSHASRNLEVFVYEDRAGFLADGRDWHLARRSEFGDDEELLRNFLEALTRRMAQG